MTIETKSAVGEISPVGSDDSFPGEFSVILSTPTKDRQGDELKSDGWQTPLPQRIQFNTDHSFSVGSTVGSGVPQLDSGGNLVVTGKYASTKHAQDTRTLVSEGHITSVSVAFKTGDDGKRELINGSFVVVPANPEAKVLVSKSDSIVETKDDGFKDGDAVYFNYRSAHDVEGHVVGIAKQGKASDTTMYKVMPLKKYIHPGEKVPVHRSGASLTHRKETKSVTPLEVVLKASKPHGNVTYADPGYLDSEGNPAKASGNKPVERYPIDTAEHVRAAWSYINRRKNADEYTDSELAHIKAKIIAAAKKFKIDIDDSSSKSLVALELKRDLEMEAQAPTEMVQAIHDAALNLGAMCLNFPQQVSDLADDVDPLVAASAAVGAGAFDGGAFLLSLDNDTLTVKFMVDDDEIACDTVSLKQLQTSPSSDEVTVKSDASASDGAAAKSAALVMARAKAFGLQGNTE